MGYINFEFNNTKVYALRSALGTIERDRPFISLDLTAGDLAEIRDILAPFEYGEIPAGRHGTIFVPKG